ncbi:helix-turn-helix domain-containing protein [Paenibacillus flagellatus]|uniref:HTH araC/xylS-type domain-containing protein n=1 Tax=Paenibacillus flagellatus TaxID=2211139 RepID=A0A2V5L1K7_9BACL|nr:helix-turn-helix domain-containing protein [Paenibacillus flagellatus]PYI56626.1 hypothetical protein DLM86_06565 [Paenibacillus flagellatus]
MKLLDRLNSVYYRLLLSYAALLLVTTAAVGTTSYVFFKSSLYGEVEKVHARMLAHTADQLTDNVVGKAQKLFLEMATRPDLLYFFDNPIPGQYARVKDVADELKGIVSMYPDVVDSAAVYYRDGNTIVSSQHGIAFLDSVPGKVAVNTDWIERMDREGKASLWIGTRKVPVNARSDGVSSELVTLAGTYPYNAAAGKAKGYYAVHLKAEAFVSMIRPSDDADRGRQWIADADGGLIADGSGRDDRDSSARAALLRAIAGSGRERDSVEGTIGGVDYLISYTTLPVTGWKLVQATPVDDYNRNATAIQRTLLLIGLAAIGAGLLMARALTSNLYGPLGSLLRTVRGLFGPPDAAPVKHENEYKQIGRLVANLSEKMSELESTVRENVPIIRHHLVSGLLHRHIANEAELEERLRLLNMSWPERYRCALIVRLDEAGMNGLGVEEQQIVLYNLIRELEHSASDSAPCAAISTSASEISAIVHSPERDESRIADTIERLSGFAERHFRIRLTASWGDWTDNPLHLHESYAQARAYLKYAYLLPDRGTFPHSAFAERERSREELPEKLSAAFAEALRSRDLEAVRTAVTTFADRLAAGCYSADYGMDRWKHLVDLYRQYVKDMNLKSGDVTDTGSMEKFRHISDIRQFREWLIDVVAQTFRFVEERGRNRGSETIERVKAHVDRSLDQELSLQAAAELVGLHPRYLSQLFKEETGVNFVDYVNRKRLEAAALLLKSTDSNVERVAAQVGFNTPAYFIKKFKELYGVTPKTYKFNYTMSRTELAEEDIPD